MELLLQRIDRQSSYTGGKLYVNGVYECDTVEDTDRDKNSNGIFDGDEKKVMHETAIPNGRYRITLVNSPKFSPKVNNRNMPLLNNVPSFTGILIHWGNSAADSSGCILVGKNYFGGRISNSKVTFLALLDKFDKAIAAGEQIWITVK